MKFSASFLFILLVVACTTYDPALVYHKNFRSGNHPLLRFDGYYGDTLANKPPAKSDFYELPTAAKPVFFYAEGSSFSADQYVTAAKLPMLIKSKDLKGSWGNYLIKGDSITLEKFQLVKSNYERIILKGVISKEQIHWTSRKEHNEAYKPVDYSIFFKKFSPKPDSLRNFTRVKEKYNQ